jgi:hypothetical protein
MSVEELFEKMTVATVIENEQVLIATYTIVVINTIDKTYSVVDPLLFTIGKAQYNDMSSIYRNQINRIPITVFK